MRLACTLSEAWRRSEDGADRSVMSDLARP
jgi:hypothetical protein